MTTHRIKEVIFDVWCDICWKEKAGVSEDKSIKFARTDRHVGDRP